MMDLLNSATQKGFYLIGAYCGIAEGAYHVVCDVIGALPVAGPMLHNAFHHKVHHQPKNLPANLKFDVELDEAPAELSGAFAIISDVPKALSEPVTNIPNEQPLQQIEQPPSEAAVHHGMNGLNDMQAPDEGSTHLPGQTLDAAADAGQPSPLLAPDIPEVGPPARATSADISKSAVSSHKLEFITPDTSYSFNSIEAVSASGDFNKGMLEALAGKGIELQMVPEQPVEGSYDMMTPSSRRASGAQLSSSEANDAAAPAPGATAAADLPGSPPEMPPPAARPLMPSEGSPDDDKQGPSAAAPARRSSTDDEATAGSSNAAQLRKVNSSKAKGKKGKAKNKGK